jgi:hypothetical protein
VYIITTFHQNANKKRGILTYYFEYNVGNYVDQRKPDFGKNNKESKKGSDSINKMLTGSDPSYPL